MTTRLLLILGLILSPIAYTACQQGLNLGRQTTGVEGGVEPIIPDGYASLTICGTVSSDDEEELEVIFYDEAGAPFASTTVDSSGRFSLTINSTSVTETTYLQAKQKKSGKVKEVKTLKKSEWWHAAADADLVVKSAVSASCDITTAVDRSDTYDTLVTYCPTEEVCKGLFGDEDAYEYRKNLNDGVACEMTPENKGCLIYYLFHDDDFRSKCLKTDNPDPSCGDIIEELLNCPGECPEYNSGRKKETDCDPDGGKRDEGAYKGLTYKSAVGFYSLIGGGDPSPSDYCCMDYTDNDGDGNTDCDDSDCSGTYFCNGGPSTGYCGDNECDLGEDRSCPEDCGGGGGGEIDCSDGTDNDGDYYTDCMDSDCAGMNCYDPYSGWGICAYDGYYGYGECSTGSPTEQNCSDGTDNDGDFFTDCMDYDCNGMSCYDGSNWGTCNTTYDGSGYCSIGNHCTNGYQDYDEAGVDCGGYDCAPCGGGHCTNGYLDYDETGIDCGGYDCAPCGGGGCGSYGEPCGYNGDCCSNDCNSASWTCM